MPRTILTDNQWNKLYNFLFCTGRIYKKAEHRKTVEGILYRIRTGIPWRDLPSYFGKWNTVFKRFNIWSKKGIIKKLLSFFNQHFDLEWVFIDGSIVKAHQDATGKGGNQAIGKSVAGNTTKLHLAVDSCGNPIDFTLTGGEVHDSKEAVHLLELIPDSEHIIADRGYDSQELREIIKTNKKAKPVIPRKQNSKIGNHDMDWCLYKYRHLVENAFAYLKRYRAVATRYDKTQWNYESVIILACCMKWLKVIVE